MPTINKCVLPLNFIDAINSEIDKIHYDSSLWIFPGTNPTLDKFVKQALAETKIIPLCILNKAYIVIRCVKANSPTTTYAFHFDNYLNTWLCPLKIPSISNNGRLWLMKNARSIPKNIYSNLASKIFFQNPITRIFIKRYFLHKFNSWDLMVGDCAHFNGFTSLHFNGPVDDERRSILVHFDKPFSNSVVTRIIEKFSQYIVS
jgi:hypothetical protein